MKASIGQIKCGVLGYVEDELIGKAPGLAQWALIAGAAIVAPKAEALAAGALQSPTARTLELVDQEGLVDLDKLKAALDKAAQKTGAVVQQVPLLGSVTFTQQDIQSVYERIARAPR